MTYRVFIYQLAHANYILLKIRRNKDLFRTCSRVLPVLGVNEAVKGELFTALEEFFSDPQNHYIDESELGEESFSLTEDEAKDHIGISNEARKYVGISEGYSGHLKEIPLTKAEVDRYLSLAVLSKLNM